MRTLAGNGNNVNDAEREPLNKNDDESPAKVLIPSFRSGSVREAGSHSFKNHIPDRDVRG